MATNAEIAAKVRQHLARFEADPEINRPRGENMKLPPYYKANCWSSGRYVGVRYVSFQGDFHLSKADAIVYLAWLDAGNIGRHWKALKAKE